MTLKINPILFRKGTMDNCAYVIVDEQTSKAAIIDASETAPIVDFCEKNMIRPEFIFTTHHHFDHVGANMDLKQRYGLKIVGPDAEKSLIEGIDICVTNGQEFSLGETKLSVISAPGHTKGHVLWYFENDKVLFTGDVLFNLCIGGLFEGTPEQMFLSLNKIKNLPDDVMFYPGHEYTRHCISSLLRNESEYAKKYAQIALDRLEHQVFVAPISLGLEKKCNPYLLIDNLKDFSRLF